MTTFGILPNSKSEKLRVPLRLLGYDPVFDYRDDQLDIQGGYGGAIMVEGTFYCLHMYGPLIDATKRYRNIVAPFIDLDQFRRLHVERKKFSLRAKQAPDPSGAVRLYCPASGPSPTVNCKYKPRRVNPLFPTVVVPSQPTAKAQICTQDTVTFPVEAIAKYGQSLDYGSDAWHEVFTAGRQTIESTNAYLKDEANEVLGAPGRRRVRGIAAAQVFASLLATAANIRKIQKFYSGAITTPQVRVGVPVKSPAARKRHTSHRSRSVQNGSPRHGTKPLTSPSPP